MGGMIGETFGTRPKQYGETGSAGQYWWADILKPMMQQGVSAGTSGSQLYPVSGLPETPTAAGYHGGGYDAPQAPYSSPDDYLGQYQDTAQNAMEQFWGGGGGSAMGGWSGSGVDEMSRVTDYATRNAMRDYQMATLPYAQMENQASQFGAGAQNQANMFRADAVNRMNTMGYSGGLQQMGAMTQSYAAPWQLTNQYPTTYATPMLGEQGAMPRWFQMWDNAF